MLAHVREQDGVLYQIRHAWSPTPLLWPPVDSCIIKSPDGGRNWVDHLGRTNPVELPTGTHSMFPALPWSWFNFVQYGKGGAAPAIDRADEYVYLTAAEYLARVPVGRLQNDGQAGTVIAFPPKTVTWMRLTIDKVRSGTVRTGLGQFEVYAVSRP